ncbi:SGNH/GDSL hydrolase family protein [Sphingomonas hankookensis]|uniref:SGNH/GDSL hydrolase family protein n=1 Tax=Sphingomonas hankookensis TaxID=563996 RepID=UPI001F5812CC|nr:hypothetical protein [Sphingomonas hankookensis]
MGPVNWANFLSGGRAVLETADSFGWNGDRSSADAGYPGELSRVDAVIASGAGTVVLVAPTANDRNTMTAQQSIDNSRIMIERLAAAGLVVVVLPDYPHGSAAFPGLILPAAQQTNWEAVNAWTLQQQGRNVYVIDTAAIMRDPAAVNGQAAAGLLNDGLHLQQQAAYLIGRAMLPLWRRLFTPFFGFPSSNHDGTTARTIAGLDTLNPYLNGTGGSHGAGGSGTMPTGWTSQLSAGLSAAFAKKTTTGFNGQAYRDDESGPLTKDWLEIVVSGTATQAAEVILLRQNYVAAMAAPHRAMAEIEIDPGYAGVNVVNLYAWQGDVAASQARAFASPGPNQSTPLPAGGLRGVLRTPLFTFTGTQNRLNLNVLPINGAVVNATIRVRAIGCGTGL